MKTPQHYLTASIIATVMGFTFYQPTGFAEEWQTIDVTTLEDIKSLPRFAKVLKACQYHRYMESSVGKALKDLPSFELPSGWEKVRDDDRLRLYSYTSYDKLLKEDKDGNRLDNTNKPRPGLVVTYSPSPERVAAWIVNAVKEVQDSNPGSLAGIDPESLEIELAKYISDQSHSQFPVVGTVWEYITKEKNLKNQGYRFLDGLTISTTSLPLKGYYFPEFKPSSTDNSLSRRTSNLRAQELDFSLHSFWGEGQIRAAKYARIASTERIMVEDLFKLMKKDASTTPRVCGNHYANYVRETHIDAMSGHRNEMFVASVLCRVKNKKWKLSNYEIDCD